MQINYVYLYSNRIDVFTNTLASWQAERYRRVYNRNIKIYRGVDNRIDIQVRNSDEKAISVANSSMVFNLFSNSREENVVQKDCTEVDATTGKMYVTLTEEELFNIEKGFYNYSIVQEVRETINESEYKVTSRTPMYIAKHLVTHTRLLLLIHSTTLTRQQQAMKILYFTFLV